MRHTQAVETLHATTSAGNLAANHASAFTPCLLFHKSPVLAFGHRLQPGRIPNLESFWTLRGFTTPGGIIWGFAGRSSLPTKVSLSCMTGFAPLVLLPSPSRRNDYIPDSGNRSGRLKSAVLVSKCLSQTFGCSILDSKCLSQTFEGSVLDSNHPYRTLHAGMQKIINHSFTNF